MANFDATRAGFGYESPDEGITNDWLTPPELVKRLGDFDLDPCGCPGQPWLLAKTTYFPPEQDGLSLPWFGKVFCNPPYGANVLRWAERMAEHRNGVLLIFSRTETKAWKYIWSTADAFVFPFSRIHFLRPDGRRGKSGTAPSALVGYGEGADMIGRCGIGGAFFSCVEILNGVAASSL